MTRMLALLTLAVPLAITTAAISLAQPVQQLHLTVTPAVHTPISIKTLPNAACKLYQGSDNAGPALKLYSDQEGIVRFHVRPFEETDVHANVTLECAAGGNVATHPIELRAASAPTPDMPAPHAPVAAATPGTFVRPALSAGDALNLSDQELQNRHYPVRPDPKDAPKAYATWLRAVSMPATLVTPHSVSRPDKVHTLRQIENGPASSNTWSGFELRGAPNTYNLVEGFWWVPSVTGEPNSQTYSSLWIGLDGDGVNDLIQAGTEQDVIDWEFLWFRWEFATYYAWTELLPQQLTEQQITSFPVNAGDDIYAEVYVLKQCLFCNSLEGVFWMENLTSHQFTGPIVIPMANSTQFVGSEAEWIMERPTLVSSNKPFVVPDLADYSSAIMEVAYARRQGSGQYVTYQGDANVQITMFNGNDVLSTVAALDANGMIFTWAAFH